MMRRHEWYQTATNVVLVIFVKKLDKSKVDVSFSRQVICSRRRLTVQPQC